jgi:glycosyltransferase involved in cell wall biosynthesis
MPDRSPPTRIGFNAALLSLDRGYRAAGIHRYIVALLRALAHEPSVQVTAFVPDLGARALLPAAVQLRRASWRVARPLGRLAWEQLVLPVALARARVDVCHGPAHAMPAACPCPAVVTVHDLSFFRTPRAFPRAQGFYLRAATRLSVRRAAALIAVSAFTARELVALLGAPAARVHVVPNGVDPMFRPVTPDEVDRVRARLALPAHFLLTVGTLQPRKNLGTLLAGYAALSAASPATPDLVIAGGSGWGGVAPEAEAARLGIGDRVHVLGYVDDADLPALYRGADVLAYPSRYEGFGLPALEAMACGTPVAVADAASLPEVTGDAAIHVDPDDPSAWAVALGALLADDARRGALVEAGLARAARYTWSRAARETAGVYAHVLAPRAVPASPESQHGRA